MVRIQITNFTKYDFFAAFSQAFKTSFNPSNTQEGFRATGIVPHNPESALARLDTKPITLFLREMKYCPVQ